MCIRTGQRAVTWFWPLNVLNDRRMQRQTGGRVRTCIAATMAVGSFVSLLAMSHAQQTLTIGDILGNGGRKLTKDELQTLWADATVSGVRGGNFSNTRFRIQATSSGSVTGDAWHGDV